MGAGLVVRGGGDAEADHGASRAVFGVPDGLCPVAVLRHHAAEVLDAGLEGFGVVVREVVDARDVEVVLAAMAIEGVEEAAVGEAGSGDDACLGVGGADAGGGAMEEFGVAGDRGAPQLLLLDRGRVAVAGGRIPPEEGRLVDDLPVADAVAVVGDGLGDEILPEIPVLPDGRAPGDGVDVAIDAFRPVAQVEQAHDGHAVPHDAIHGVLATRGEVEALPGAFGADVDLHRAREADPAGAGFGEGWDRLEAFRIDAPAVAAETAGRIAGDVAFVHGGRL